MIAGIAAVSSNGMIGMNGWLPWDIPEDVAYFENMIVGAALVVGSRTYHTMAVVPPDTFVVSRQPDLQLRPGCRQVESVEAGIAAGIATGKPVFVIGGAPIYEAAWPYCERFYLTRIEASFPGDTPLPASIPFDRWRIVEETSKTYRERRTGVDVVCRFIEYAQDNPQALP